MTTRTNTRGYNLTQRPAYAPMQALDPAEIVSLMQPQQQATPSAQQINPQISAQSAQPNLNANGSVSFGPSTGGFANGANVRDALNIAGALGMLTKNPELSDMAGKASTVYGAATAKTPAQAALVAAPFAAKALGLPSGVLGLGYGLATGNKAMAIDSALMAINPMVGAVNAIAKAILGTSIGSAVSSPDPEGTGLTAPSQSVGSTNSSGGNYGFSSGRTSAEGMGGGSGLTSNSSGLGFSSRGFGFGD